MWVLLVDDDADTLELGQAYLENAGFVVAVATHGWRALQLLDAIAPARPAVIVSDMMMPVMDGLELLSALRERPVPPPVVAVSGLAVYLEQAQRLGAAALLPKPYSAKDLVDAVRRVAEGRKVPRKLPGPPILADERRRIREIVSLQLDRAAPEPSLQVFVAAIARAFDAPMCFVSIITESSQFWMAACGMPNDLAAARGGPRAESFCTHAVAARSDLVVQDAADNPYFRENPFVTKRGVRFYAGVPLVGRRGDTLGTLCLLDYKPREFSHFEVELLGVLARRILAAFELRENLVTEVEREYLGYMDRESGLFAREGFIELLAIEMWRHARSDAPLALVLADTGDERCLELGRTLTETFAHVWVGRLGLTRIGAIVPDCTAATAHKTTGSVAGAKTRLLVVQADGPGNLARQVLGRAEAELIEAGRSG